MGDAMRWVGWGFVERRVTGSSFAGSIASWSDGQYTAAGRGVKERSRRRRPVAGLYSLEQPIREAVCPEFWKNGAQPGVRRALKPGASPAKSTCMDLSSAREGGLRC